MRTPTAAILVIGNEVLSAKVQDANGPWLAGRLRELGVKLVAMHTVLDRTDDIVEMVSRVHRRVDWVFTSGGVGPTHDDLTVAAVALALGRPIERLPALEASLRAMHRRHTGSPDLPEAALRMADVPRGTRLVGEPGFPTLVVENVVMLPGVPEFFRFQFERFAPELAAPPFRLACVFSSLGEDVLAPLLEGVALEHPDVEIGSYPRFDATDHRVKITLEGKDGGRVAAALRALLAVLPAGGVVRTEGP